MLTELYPIRFFRLLRLFAVFVLLQTGPSVAFCHEAVLSNAAALNFTPEEREWLGAHQEVTVAVSEGWAPIEFHSPDGDFRGISIDYLHHLESILKIKFKLVSSVENPSTEKADMLSAISNPKNVEGSRFMALRQPYLKMPFVIFTRSDNTDIHNLDDLAGKRVAVFKSGSAGKLLAAEHPEIDLYRAEIADHALAALASGKVDAYVGNLIVISYVARNQGIGNIKVAGDTPYSSTIHFAVRNDWPLFASILQKGLNQIDDQHRNEISRNWVAVTYEHQVNYHLLISITLVAFIIILSFVIWNKKLNNEINRRKVVEAELIKAKEYAEAGNRVKSQFLASMSHEIRTPMNGILGLSKLLSEGGLDDGARDNFSRTIYDSAYSLLAILNDILDMSKIEAGKLQIDAQPFNPSLVAQDVYQLFSSAAKTKGLSFKLEFNGPVDEKYMGDAARLRQILCNLISNAIKFTEQGEVKVTANIKKVNQAPGKLWLKFSVSDSGIGIDHQSLPNLFQPFTQAESSITRRYGGTGLGLSISKELCKLMGGDIGVDSVVGHGSTFWFQVQVDDLHLPEASQTELPAVSTVIEKTRALDSFRILVVDDNAVNIKVIGAFLSKFGFHFIPVSDGQQALDMLTSDQFDLVLMDVHMPVMDGLQATTEIRKRELNESKPRIPIVALTAASYKEDRDRCFAAGMDDFLTKPVNQDMLASILNKWLRLDSISSDTTANSTPRKPEPDQEAPLDIDQLMAYLDNSEEMANELLKTFQETLADLPDQLDQALVSRNSQELRRIAHTLKGSSSVLFASGVVSLSRRTELFFAAAVDDWDRGRDIVNALKVEIDKASTFIAARGLTAATRNIST